MVKRIVWTNTARRARREILEYWKKNNGSSAYSKRLSNLFRIKIALLQTDHYLGKPTDFKDVRVSLVSHFSIFYKVWEEEIIIVGIWDNRRDPGDLHKNLTP